MPAYICTLSCAYLFHLDPEIASNPSSHTSDHLQGHLPSGCQLQVYHAAGILVPRVLQALADSLSCSLHQLVVCPLLQSYVSAGGAFTCAVCCTIPDGVSMLSLAQCSGSCAVVSVHCSQLGPNADAPQLELTQHVQASDTWACKHLILLT